MSKNTYLSAVALAALAAPAFAQSGTPVLPPAATVVYNGFSRGFSFTAQNDFFIQDTELDATAFQAGDTGGVRVAVNGVEVFYSVGNAAGANGNCLMTPSNGPIQVFTGDLVEVVGNWSPATTGQFSAHNSYGAGGGTYATPVEGVSTTMFRAGVQWDIGDPGYATAATFNGAAGSIGRVTIYTTPPSGLFASFTATPNAGASPLIVTFTDTSFTSDPGGILSQDWDFDGDGVTDATGPTATWAYGACGSYDVTLTVSDATNGTNTNTVVGAVAVDDVVADFGTPTEVAPGSGVWQFTDTSTPTPTAWAWDFDGDGNVDDTTQNPVYVQTVPAPILDLPNCTLTVTGAGGCFTDTLVRGVSATGFGVASGPTTGGNGTASANGVGTYWDMQVGPAEGVNITGVQVGVYGFAGTADVEIYITPGSHVGKEGIPAEWTLAGGGPATFNGTGTVGAPELASVSLGQSFFLPAGDYGVAVFQADQAGAAMQVSYTNGPGASPYGNADIVIHPNGVGCSVTTGTLGPCAFQPRLWNGRLAYETCATAGMAAAGPFASGCVNSAGSVPSLSVTSLPQLGGSLDLELDAQLPAPSIALMIIGVSKDTFNGLPLPLDLAILGAPGCNLATSTEVTSTLTTLPGTPAPFSVSVPNNSALTCFQFYQQAAVLDGAANAFGFVLSNATAASAGN
ncbi:MAG: PKD domain-containing protein [Planctomycetota bacterium]|nr:PKD domain-containing protein [Planctomycetota bacterium]